MTDRKLPYHLNWNAITADACRFNCSHSCSYSRGGGNRRLIPQVELFRQSLQNILGCPADVPHHVPRRADGVYVARSLAHVDRRDAGVLAATSEASSSLRASTSASLPCHSRTSRLRYTRPTIPSGQGRMPSRS